jgi:UDP:flavonoid glycosyltransferase YjiC (YdhE family)
MGSLGDLHPFIALGRALRDRGVNAVIACAEEYRSRVEAAGVAFKPVRPGLEDMQNDLGMSRAELTQHLVRHNAFLFRRLVLPYVRTAYEDMMSVTADADLVLASSLSFGARLAAEKRDIPWIAVVLQPMMFLSSHDPPVIPGAEGLSAVLRRLGPAPTRCAMWCVKRAVNGLLRPVHRLRADIGLEPASQDPLFEGQFSAAGAIALYSRLLGKTQPDFPRPTWIAGFATFDSADGAAVELDPDLEAFMKAGTAPLVFTLGSLVVNSPGSFYEESVSVAHRSNRRAVLLVGEEGVGDLARLRSAQVFVCAYAPHSLVFPGAAAIIHHGGIGTLAQALRSGRPQLIVPYFADQIDNAARAARLGVARISPPRRYTGASASRDLARLFGGDAHLSKARQAAEFLAAEDGAAEAARIVLDRLELLGRK